MNVLEDGPTTTTVPRAAADEAIPAIAPLPLVAPEPVTEPTTFRRLDAGDHRGEQDRPPHVGGRRKQIVQRISLVPDRAGDPIGALRCPRPAGTFNVPTPHA